jgi:hypothetical protein
MVFAIACSAGYLWATYIVPETANVSLEEIDAVFKSPAARDDMQLKLQVSILSIDFLEVIRRDFQIERNLGLHDLIREIVAE